MKNDKNARFRNKIVCIFAGPQTVKSMAQAQVKHG